MNSFTRLPIRFIFALIFLPFAFSACRDDEDDVVIPSVQTLACSYTTNTTLLEAVYEVNCDVIVSNATLSIPAGAKLVFKSGTKISTSNGGAINAMGTSVKPIVFTGKEAIKGYWKGVDINTNSLNNTFSHCRFEYGGSGQSMVRLGGDNSEICKAVFTSCIFDGSAANGLFVNEQSSIAGSTANQFKNNNEYAVWMAYENVSELDNSNQFSNNVKNKVYVKSDDFTINELVVFNKISVPYVLDNTPSNPLKKIVAGFEIKPGTVIEMSPNFMLEVQSSGYFKAQGTAAEPIIIRGIEPVKGYWDKIRFKATPSASNIMQYCIISDGGNYYDNAWFDKGMVTTRKDLSSTPRLQITDCTFKNSLNYAIDLYQCAASGAMLVNGQEGALAIKAALESANQFPNPLAADANNAGNVRTTE